MKTFRQLILISLLSDCYSILIDKAFTSYNQKYETSNVELPLSIKSHGRVEGIDVYYDNVQYYSETCNMVLAKGNTCTVTGLTYDGTAFELVAEVTEVTNVYKINIEKFFMFMSNQRLGYWEGQAPAGWHEGCFDRECFFDKLNMCLSASLGTNADYIKCFKDVNVNVRDANCLRWGDADTCCEYYSTLAYQDDELNSVHVKEGYFNKSANSGRLYTDQRCDDIIPCRWGNDDFVGEAYTSPYYGVAFPFMQDNIVTDLTDCGEGTCGAHQRAFHYYGRDDGSSENAGVIASFEIVSSDYEIVITGGNAVPDGECYLANKTDVCTFSDGKSTARVVSAHVGNPPDKVGATLNCGYSCKILNYGYYSALAGDRFPRVYSVGGMPGPSCPFLAHDSSAFFRPADFVVTDDDFNGPNYPGSVTCNKINYELYGGGATYFLFKVTRDSAFDCYPQNFCFHERTYNPNWLPLDQTVDEFEKRFRTGFFTFDSIEFGDPVSTRFNWSDRADPNNLFQCDSKHVYYTPENVPPRCLKDYGISPCRYEDVYASAHGFEEDTVNIQFQIFAEEVVIQAPPGLPVSSLTFECVGYFGITQGAVLNIYNTNSDASEVSFSLEPGTYAPTFGNGLYVWSTFIGDHGAVSNTMSFPVDAATFTITEAYSQTSGVVSCDLEDGIYEGVEGGGGGFVIEENGKGFMSTPLGKITGTTVIVATIAVSGIVIVSCFRNVSGNAKSKKE